MRRTSTALALIMAVSTAPALAQVQWTFSDIDSDDNLELSDREFEQVSRDMFSSANADQNDVIDESEFDSFVDEYDLDAGFGDWDLDSNDGLDREEFHEGLYAVYDADGDDVLDEQEFAQSGLGNRSGQAAAAGTAGGADIVSLSDWGYDALYQNGFSSDDFIDDTEVYGESGDPIGDVEDLLIGTNGRVVAVIAEVGGFWDIGDSHVSIPWSDVRMTEDGEGIVVPVTEDNVDDYGVYDNAFLSRDEASGQIIGEVDDAIARSRMWRVSELIGDYARTREGGTYTNYGYVNDVIVRDGQVSAVVVEPDTGYGLAGRYAYPYYGYDNGTDWTPGSTYYNMPYSSDEASRTDRFDYEQLGGET